MIPSNLIMTNTTANNMPVISEYELSELDEAIWSLVMADSEIRERVARLGKHPARGADLRKETLELMTDIHRLKKFDKEFYYNAPPSDSLKDQLHPLQGYRNNVAFIFDLMTQTKKEIASSLADTKEKPNSKKLEQKLDKALLEFIDEAQFYLKQAPPRH